MTCIQLLASIAIATAVVGGSAVAHTVHAQVPADQTRQRGDHPQKSHEGRTNRATPLWLPVANPSTPEQQAYGWQYFSDRRASRAVVISPAGAYYLSLGKGLRQITGPAGQRLTTG